MENRSYYTAGIFAKKAGVTLRTIRYYDKMGLLKPSGYTHKGYRLYTDYEFAKLQKILTLKFLGLSLEEIKNAIDENRAEEKIEKEEFIESLSIQKNILQEKIDHMSCIVKAINETEAMLESNDELDWEKFVNIIKIVNMESILIEQYKNSTNLKSRINLHDKFSRNKYGWHRWIFDHLEFFKDAEVLELGCGDGSLWSKNVDRVPYDCGYILTDVSTGMLEDAKNNLKAMEGRFDFDIANAEKIPYEDESFDIVIANNVLFYAENTKKAISEIKRVLKPGGKLLASTIGKDHMIELYDITREFDPCIHYGELDPVKQFGLENGSTQLSEYFSEVELHLYDDVLLVNEVEPLIDYVNSIQGNAAEVLKKRYKQFHDILRKRIDKDGYMSITKNSGLFIAKK